MLPKQCLVSTSFIDERRRCFFFTFLSMKWDQACKQIQSAKLKKIKQSSRSTTTIYSQEREFICVLQCHIFLCCTAYSLLTSCERPWGCMAMMRRERQMRQKERSCSDRKITRRATRTLRSLRRQQRSWLLPREKARVKSRPLHAIITVPLWGEFRPLLITAMCVPTLESFWLGLWEDGGSIKRKHPVTFWGRCS